MNSADAPILVLSRRAGHYRQLLEAHLPVPLLCATSADQLPATYRSAEIALADPALIAPLLSQLPHLRWLQSTFAGVDALLRPGLPAAYQLTNIKGIFGPLISEYVFAYLLQIRRHLREYRCQQQQALWAPLSYRGLRDATMVILGTGSIGTHLATTARHFGMTVLGINRSGRQVAPFQQCVPWPDRQAVLSQANVVVSVLPATASTVGQLDSRFFAQLPDQALFFNVGRGSTVDEVALLNALQSRRLKMAVLDVFAHEPLPREHPFWFQSNLLVTPHIAAESFADDIARIFLDNLQRFQRGQPLRYRVDRELGY